MGLSISGQGPFPRLTMKIVAPVVALIDVQES